MLTRRNDLTVRTFTLNKIFEIFVKLSIFREKKSQETLYRKITITPFLFDVIKRLGLRSCSFVTLKYFLYE